MAKVLVIVLVILAALVAIFVFFWGRTPEEEMLPQIDFEKTGNLVNNWPGMELDVWFLIYEGPGAPAVSAKLIFNDKSVCLSGSDQSICDENSFSQGERVDVKGVQRENGVYVSELRRQEAQFRTIRLYYYNSELDKDASGNVLCSRQGLVSVERRIPVTITPIQDTIRLLIQGGLTQEEEEIGISTEYPLDGISLESASLNDGVLTLTFTDSNSRTSGGACRAGILWFQIEATALQFPEGKSVQF